MKDIHLSVLLPNKDHLLTSTQPVVRVGLLAARYISITSSTNGFLAISSPF
ncbi:hypothetical protein [Cytobacillus kochii]|uniref:hypothetical protein n=1 Tax=Cytobacillus kochii TaxID=859143 RepID=UPI00402A82B1